MAGLVEFDAMVGDLGDMAKEKGEKRSGEDLQLCSG